MEHNQCRHCGRRSERVTLGLSCYHCGHHNRQKTVGEVIVLSLMFIAIFGSLARLVIM